MRRLSAILVSLMGRHRLSEFIARYGERGYAVLKAIIEEASSNWASFKLGDFSFKGVKKRLASWGLDYNPSLLLARLEREYGVIETSYKSSSQHWWVILDRDALEEAVREYEGVDESPDADLRVKALRLQFYSLEPLRILGQLKRMLRQGRLSSQEKKLLRRIAFEEVPLLVEFAEKAIEYRDALSRELSIAEEIISTAEKLVAMMIERTSGLEDSSLRGLFKPRKESPESQF